MSARTHYVEAIAASIKAALQDGQKHKHMLCSALQRDYHSIDATMAEMRRRGEIVVLGTAKQAGYKGIRVDAPVYGLPGMVLQRVSHTKGQARGGSGVLAGRITIPQYRYGSTRLG